MKDRIKTCLGCGRDTLNRSGICRLCQPSRQPTVPLSKHEFSGRLETGFAMLRGELVKNF